MEGTTHLFHIHMENRADIFIFMSHAQLITPFYVCGMQNVTMAETLLLYCLQYIIIILYLTSVKFAKLYNIRQLKWKHLQYGTLHINHIL